MKYRLTVKGQVALATVVLLIFIMAVSFGHSNNSKPADAEALPSPTDKASTIMPAAAVPDQSLSGNDAVQTDKAAPVNAPTEEQMKKNKATVYFDPNKWEIQAAEIQKVAEITEMLLKYRDLRIVVEGNINGSAGSADSEFGLDLSEKRAQVVAQVLIGKGIDEARIIVKSNGSSEPATSDPDKAWMNRRTDVYIEGFRGDSP